MASLRLRQHICTEIRFGVKIEQARWGSSECEVSSFGRVRSSTGVISSGHLTWSGYRRVMINRQRYYVHRLVAATFLGSPPDPSKWQVNHMDGDGANNALTNLEYVSPAENQLHSYETNRSRRRGGNSLSKAVLWRPSGEESWRLCSSQAEAERLLGLSRGTVSRCCRGGQAAASAYDVCYEFRPVNAPTISYEEGEVWKGARYPGRLDAIPNLTVSSHGRVWSQTWHQNTRVTRGTEDRQGYFHVSKAGRFLLVHRLVAATFLGQPRAAGLYVNHIDGDRGNNHFHNLEYATPSENVKHAYSRMRTDGRHKTGKGKGVLVKEIGFHESWQAFDSLTAAARHTGISVSHISQVCRGLRRHAGPWEFKFAPQQPVLGEEWRPVVLEGARVTVLRSNSMVRTGQKQFGSC